MIITRDPGATVMQGLESDQIQIDYQQDGFCFPLEVMSRQQAGAYRAQLEVAEVEIEARNMERRGQLNHMHVVLRFANEIVRNDRILDAVEALIGPDIMVWGSTFFIKEPNTAGFVSWHQDLRYWGLEDSDAMVSAWLALGPVNQANGCMRFIPGSHHKGLAEHEDHFDAENFLYRGQRAQVEIDESSAVQVELEPGQMSLHHGYLLHASAPNLSAQRRIGLTMNFIAPRNRQVVASRDYAMLVRGEDRYGHFEALPAPESDLSDSALEWHRRMLAAHDEASYQGVGAVTNS